MDKFSTAIRSQRPARIWLASLFIQIISWAFVLSVVYATFKYKLIYFWPLLYIAIFQGVVAAFLSRRIRQPGWWVLIHLGFFPLVALLYGFSLSSWLYLAAFLFLVLIFWTTFKTRVPFFLTNTQTEEKLAELIDKAQPKQFLDLGCASGGLIKKMATAFPDIHFSGFEIAPLPLLLAKWRLRKIPNATIQYGDFWKLNFADYDFIYAFLSDEPMCQLWEKVTQEMLSGSVFVTNTFAVPDIMPHQTIDVSDFRGTQLMIWEFSSGPLYQPEDGHHEAAAIHEQASDS